MNKELTDKIRSILFHQKLCDGCEIPQCFKCEVAESRARKIVTLFDKPT